MRHLGALFIVPCFFISTVVHAVRQDDNAKLCDTSLGAGQTSGPSALFESRRYLFTPVTGENALAVARVVATPEVSFRYGTAGDTLTIVEGLAKNKGAPLAVLSKATGAVAGYAYASPSKRYPQDSIREYEVGLRIAPDHWRAAGESEVLRALLLHSMAERGAHSVVYVVPQDAPAEVIAAAQMESMVPTGNDEQRRTFSIRDSSYWLLRNYDGLVIPDSSWEEF
jgi:hypothetical protein